MKNTENNIEKKQRKGMARTSLLTTIMVGCMLISNGIMRISDTISSPYYSTTDKIFYWFMIGFGAFSVIFSIVSNIVLYIKERNDTNI